MYNFFNIEMHIKPHRCTMMCKAIIIVCAIFAFCLHRRGHKLPILTCNIVKPVCYKTNHLLYNCVMIHTSSEMPNKPVGFSMLCLSEMWL